MSEIMIFELLFNNYHDHEQLLNNHPTHNMN